MLHSGQKVTIWMMRVTPLSVWQNRGNGKDHESSERVMRAVTGCNNSLGLILRWREYQMIESLDVTSEKKRILDIRSVQTGGVST